MAKFDNQAAQSQINAHEPTICLSNAVTTSRLIGNPVSLDKNIVLHTGCTSFSSFLHWHL